MTQQAQSAEYEFTDTQNVTIRALAGAMKFVAIVELVLGILYLVLAVISFLGANVGGAIVYGVTGVITIVLATMLSKAAGYFRSVVDSQGSDIMLMMGALEHLGSYFNIKRVLYIIAMVLIALGIVLVVMLGMRSSGGTKSNQRSMVELDRSAWVA